MDIKALVPMSLRYRVMEFRGRGIYSGYADEYQCIFIHIPKAAGTSIARTLFNKGSRHVRYIEYEKANRKKFKRYFKFTFVRNPWDRLVSTYSFLKKGGLNDQDQKWAKENLYEYPDFEAFILGWLNEVNICTWIHFYPQHHFICDPEGIVTMDFVGKFENIENDFSYVADKLGCTQNLIKTNTGSLRHYSSYYTEETREIVQRVYSKDIQLFGYDYEK